MINILQISFKLSIIAFIYSEVLVAGGMILNPWYKFLERKIGHLEWLFKPLVDCGKCVAGQLSFWVYLVFYFYNYSIIDHLFCICFSIALVIIFKHYYQKLRS